MTKMISASDARGLAIVSDEKSLELAEAACLAIVPLIENAAKEHRFNLRLYGAFFGYGDARNNTKAYKVAVNYLKKYGYEVEPFGVTNTDVRFDTEYNTLISWDRLNG